MVSSAFRDARKASLIDQKRFGEMIHVSTPTVSKYENDPLTMSIGKAVEWYEACGNDGRKLISDFIGDLFFCRRS